MVEDSRCYGIIICMLSPASLRVCCLAVMAPALTKADRQADCLPVVLPEPYYESKTADILNSEDINKITISKLGYKTAWPPSHRKSYMPKVWLRQSDRSKHVFPFKTRFSAADIRKPSAYSGIEANAAHKNTPWHYTKVIATFTDKLRLKYTMSKNTTTNTNMGLAKANTSLGLQDLKKMKKISQLHLNKEDTTLLESDGDTSPDLSESVSSDFQGRTLLTVVSPVSKDILNKNHVFAPDCDAITPSASRDGLNSEEFKQSAEVVDESKSNSSECMISNCSISEFSSGLKVADAPLASNSAPAIGNEAECSETTGVNDTSFIEDSDKCLLDSSSSSTSSSDSLFRDDLRHFETQDIVLIPSSIVPSSSADNISKSLDLKNTSDLLLPCSSSLSSCEERLNPMFLNVFSEMPSINCAVSEDKFNASNILFSKFGASTNINSPVTTALLLELVEWEKSLSKEGTALVQSSEVCCNLTLEERKSISELVAEKERMLTSGIEHLQLLQCQQMNAHVAKQVQNFVGYYQTKLGISCQRPLQPSSSKPGKEIVDLKAELLQSEDVKNLSTAALVSLVRKLESSGTPGKLLPQQKNAINSPDSPSEKVSVVFDPEDFADIKHTSNVLLSSMKNALKSVDSDLTDESSEEDNLTELKFEEVSDTDSSDTKRSWKCLAESTALRSRSSWLIAQIQELEYQLRYYDGKLKESNTVQDVCFKEPITSERTALSVSRSDVAGIETSTKQVTLKNLIRPVNGYLDHSTIADATHVMSSKGNWLESTQLEVDLEQNKTSTPVMEESCCRTRPVKIPSSKHKLIYVDPLPTSNNKVSKLSTINCYCNSLNAMQPCVLCAGCYNSVQSVDPDSMALHDRIAILDPIFHPVLSLEKEIPMGLHFENTLKITEAQYQVFRPTSPVMNHRRMRFGAKPKHFSEMRNHRKFNRYARSLLSAKYRNKHVQNSKHLRKHRLVFGKWRRLNKNKRSFHRRDHMRRFSFASSGSSHDSPELSPMSFFDDGSGLDYMKRRRDDDQFDIDDVILPLNSKIGRTVEVLKYKDIACPSWRFKDKQGHDDTEEIENTSHAVFIRRHDRSEIEERKQLRSSPFGLNRRARRMHRCDSRADSSGANTPDPFLLYNQDIMFQVPNSLTAGPSSPALSPPTTPSSTAVVSDDSQPSFGNGPAGFEKRKQQAQKRPLEDCSRAASNDADEIQPYTKREFPLTDQDYEMALAASTHLEEDMDNPNSGPSCPVSPESYTSSTSTVEEDDDITDPEWTVVKRESGPNQALVLKFAKR